MYVYRYYVVMFVLPTSHKPLEGCFDDDTFQLHQKDPDIVFQKKILFLGHMVNLGAVCPEVMQPYISWSTLRIFFFEIFQHDGTQQVEKGNLNVNIFIKILLLRKWEFSVLQNDILGKVEIHASEGNYKFCYGLNFYQAVEI